MDIQNFGEKLKNARVSKNIDLDSLSRYSKISVSKLKSLEEENFKELPSVAFLKGYVRTLCSILGIDNQEYLDSLEASYSKFKSGDKNTRFVDIQSELEHKTTGHLLKKFMMSLVILSFVSIVVYFFMYRSQKVQEYTGQTPQEIVNTQTPEVSPSNPEAPAVPQPEAVLLEAAKKEEQKTTAVPEEKVKKLAEEKKAKDLAKEEEMKKIEEAKKAAEMKKAEEAKKASEMKKAEEEKKAAEMKKAEEAKKAAEMKKAEEAKKASEVKKEAENAELAPEKANVVISIVAKEDTRLRYQVDDVSGSSKSLVLKKGDKVSVKGKRVVKFAFESPDLIEFSGTGIGNLKFPSEESKPTTLIVPPHEGSAQLTIPRDYK